MNDAANPRALLLAYLLGELTSADRERLEERMLGDPAFSDELMEAEYDLIDDYHAARLSRAEQSRVERAFPRERLTGLSAAFIRRSERGSSAFKQEDSTRSKRRLGAGPLLVFATLAMAAIATVSTYLYLRRHTSAPETSAKTTAVDQKARAASSGKTVPQTPLGSAAHEDNAAAILVLYGDAVRGATASTLELHPGTRSVTVQWVAPPGNNEPAFQLAIVRDNSSVIVVQQAGLHLTDGRRVAEFHLKPSDFAMRSAQAHDLFVVKSTARHAIEGEYSVFIERENN